MSDIGYRLRVLAPNAYSAVHFIGGWIYDQARAGWAVTVYLPDPADDLPLRVLGAKATALADLPPVRTAIAPTRSHLSVAAELLKHDNHVQSMVERERVCSTEELSIWGDTVPRHLDEQTTTTTHHPSSAAALFKFHALQKFGATETLLRHETIYTVSVPHDATQLRRSKDGLRRRAR